MMDMALVCINYNIQLYPINIHYPWHYKSGFFAMDIINAMFPRGRGWHCLPRDSWFTEAPVDPRDSPKSNLCSTRQHAFDGAQPVEIHGNPWEIRGTSMDNMDKSSWYDISRLYQSGNFGSVPHFSYTRMNHDIDQLVVHLVGTLSWRWMTLIGLLSCAVSVVLLSLFFSSKLMNKHEQTISKSLSLAILVWPLVVMSRFSSILFILFRWPWQIKQWNVIFIIIASHGALTAFHIWKVTFANLIWGTKYAQETSYLIYLMVETMVSSGFSYDSP